MTGTQLSVTIGAGLRIPIRRNLVQSAAPRNDSL